MYISDVFPFCDVLPHINQILCGECGFMSSEIESRIRSTNHNKSALLLQSKFHNRRSWNWNCRKGLKFANLDDAQAG